ncbi:MAG: AAA family ATPase [Clostridia bacterium]|nr:AAA family ATPase [Clostridia bacterium]
MEEFEREQRRIDAVREKIRSKIGRNKDYLQSRKREIVGLRKFTWDEYAHQAPEPSQRAEFQRQENEYSRRASEQDRLAALYPSPYFARIDFREDGEAEAEPVYIGKFSFLDDEGLEMLVCDWRAPVASVFYDYEYGRAAYSSPDGAVEGELTLKRQFLIHNGVLSAMFDSSLEIQDEILQQILSHNVDEKMRTIVTTIQREQNRAIRDEKNGVLVISGPAGSGKTSIALHRIAYLLYHHRSELSEDNIVIFSPNDVFNDYISDVLPSLGEKNVRQTTFEEFVGGMLPIGREGYDEFMESMIGGALPARRVAAAKHKGSREFTLEIERRLAQTDEEGPSFAQIAYRGVPVVTGEELSGLFCAQTRRLTIEERLCRVRAEFFTKLAGVKKQRIIELSAELVEKNGESYYLNKRAITCEARMFWYRDFLALEAEYNRKNMADAFRIYAQLLQGGFGVDECAEFGQSLAGGRLRFEDAAPLLYIRCLLGELRPADTIRQIVIDEAQDYTFLQYRVFASLFRRAGFTILGDAMQTLNPAVRHKDLDYIVEAFGERGAGHILLTTAYRSTKEINEYAARILGGECPVCVERHGEEPLEAAFACEQEKADFIREKLRQESAGSTTAVITKTTAEAVRLHELLGGDQTAKLIASSDGRLSRGALVLPCALAKGLEFDSVIVDASCGEFDRNLLYICCTRALHRLTVIGQGQKA